MDLLRKILFAGVLSLGFAASVRAASEPVVWLEFCDTCSELSSFEQSALRALSPESTIYVLNRNTGEVHKFLREFDREDGLMVWVIEIPMKDFENRAFAADFEQASVNTVPIGREDLGRFQSELFPIPPADSVIDDLQEGLLDGRFQAKFTDFIEFGNFLPTTAELGKDLGAEILGNGFNAGENRVYYPRNKTFVINYPDGSQLVLVVDPGLSLVRAAAFDALGQQIQFTVEADGSSAQINPDSFENRPVEFAPRRQQAVNDLIRALRRIGGGGGGGGSDGLSCSSTITANGNVRITCPKLN